MSVAERPAGIPLSPPPRVHCKHGDIGYDELMKGTLLNEPHSVWCGVYPPPSSGN